MSRKYEGTSAKGGNKIHTDRCSGVVLNIRSSQNSISVKAARAYYRRKEAHGSNVYGEWTRALMAVGMLGVILDDISRCREDWRTIKM